MDGNSIVNYLKNRDNFLSMSDDERSDFLTKNTMSAKDFEMLQDMAYQPGWVESALGNFAGGVETGVGSLLQMASTMAKGSDPYAVGKYSQSGENLMTKFADFADNNAEWLNNKAQKNSQRYGSVGQPWENMGAWDAATKTDYVFNPRGMLGEITNAAGTSTPGIAATALLSATPGVGPALASMGRLVGGAGRAGVAMTGAKMLKGMKPWLANKPLTSKAIQGGLNVAKDVAQSVGEGFSGYGLIGGAMEAFQDPAENLDNFIKMGKEQGLDGADLDKFVRDKYIEQGMGELVPTILSDSITGGLFGMHGAKALGAGSKSAIRRGAANTVGLGLNMAGEGVQEVSAAQIGDAVLGKPHGDWWNPATWNGEGWDYNPNFRAGFFGGAMGLPNAVYNTVAGGPKTAPQNNLNEPNDSDNPQDTEPTTRGGNVVSGGINVSGYKGADIAQMVQNKLRERGYNLPLDWIYAQMAHETDGFDSDLAQNHHNYSGMTVNDPETEESAGPLPENPKYQYRHFNSDEEYAEAYAKNLAAYADDGVFDAKNMAEFAQALKNGGWYTDSVENYLNGMNRFLGEGSPSETDGRGYSADSLNMSDPKLGEWTPTSNPYSEDFNNLVQNGTPNTAEEYLKLISDIGSSEDKTKADNALETKDAKKQAEVAKELGYGQQAELPMNRIIAQAAMNGQVTFKTPEAAQAFARSPLGKEFKQTGDVTFTAPQDFAQRDDVKKLMADIFKVDENKPRQNPYFYEKMMAKRNQQNPAENPTETPADTPTEQPTDTNPTVDEPIPPPDDTDAPTDTPQTPDPTPAPEPTPQPTPQTPTPTPVPQTPAPTPRGKSVFDGWDTPRIARAGQAMLKHAMANNLMGNLVFDPLDKALKSGNADKISRAANALANRLRKAGVDIAPFLANETDGQSPMQTEAEQAVGKIIEQFKQDINSIAVDARNGNITIAEAQQAMVAKRSENNMKISRYLGQLDTAGKINKREGKAIANDARGQMDEYIQQTLKDVSDAIARQTPVDTPIPSEPTPTETPVEPTPAEPTAPTEQPTEPTETPQNPTEQPTKPKETEPTKIDVNTAETNDIVKTYSHGLAEDEKYDAYMVLTEYAPKKQGGSEKRADVVITALKHGAKFEEKPKKGIGGVGYFLSIGEGYPVVEVTKRQYLFAKWLIDNGLKIEESKAFNGNIEDVVSTYLNHLNATESEKQAIRKGLVETASTRQVSDGRTRAEYIADMVENGAGFNEYGGLGTKKTYDIGFKDGHILPVEVTKIQYNFGKWLQTKPEIKPQEQPKDNPTDKPIEPTKTPTETPVEPVETPKPTEPTEQPKPTEPEETDDDKVRKIKAHYLGKKLFGKSKYGTTCVFTVVGIVKEDDGAYAFSVSDKDTGEVTFVKIDNLDMSITDLTKTLETAVDELTKEHDAEVEKTNNALVDGMKKILSEPRESAYDKKGILVAGRDHIHGIYMNYSTIENKDAIETCKKMLADFEETLYKEALEPINKAIEDAENGKFITPENAFSFEMDANTTLRMIKIDLPKDVADAKSNEIYEKANILGAYSTLNNLNERTESGEISPSQASKEASEYKARVIDNHGDEGKDIFRRTINKISKKLLTKVVDEATKFSAKALEGAAELTPDGVEVKNNFIKAFNGMKFEYLSKEDIEAAGTFFAYRAQFAAQLLSKLGGKKVTPQEYADTVSFYKMPFRGNADGKFTKHYFDHSTPYYSDPAGDIRKLGVRKDADLKTLVHEIGHMILHDLHMMTLLPNCPDVLVKDFEAISKWLGHTNSNNNPWMNSLDKSYWTDKAPHGEEPWAQAWPKYLAEGKTPIPALNKLFDYIKKRIMHFIEKYMKSLKNWPENTQKAKWEKEAYSLDFEIPQDIREALDRSLYLADDILNGIEPLDAAENIGKGVFPIVDQYNDRARVTEKGKRKWRDFNAEQQESSSDIAGPASESVSGESETHEGYKKSDDSYSSTGEKVTEEKDHYGQYYEELDDATKKAVDDWCNTDKENGKAIGVLIKADAFKDTKWAKCAVDAIRVRIALEDLLNGNEPSVKSALDSHSLPSKLLAKKTRKDRIKVIKDHFTDNHVLTKNEKVGLSFNGSYLNCRPSLDCAKFCYAAKNYHQSGTPASIVKSEIIDFMVKEDHMFMADQIQAELNKSNDHRAGARLRISDKGDICDSYFPLFEELNRRGIYLQAFSKRPAQLRRLMKMSDKNVTMLSIDESNYGMVKMNPDLPIAYAYSGTDNSVKQLFDLINRFQTEHGVILPIRIGRNYLSQEKIDKIPEELSKYVCPIDGREKKIGEYTCTQCDLNGDGGCFYLRSVKDFKNDEPTKVTVREVTEDEAAAMDDGQLMRTVMSCVKAKLARAGFDKEGPQGRRMVELLEEMRGIIDSRGNQRDLRGTGEGVTEKTDSNTGRNGLDESVNTDDERAERHRKLRENVTFGLRINNGTALQDFVNKILDGLKKVETRNIRAGKQIDARAKVGDRIALITNGKILGFATIAKKIVYKDIDDFIEQDKHDETRHFVDPNDEEYGWGDGKVGYLLEDIEDIRDNPIKIDNPKTPAGIINIEKYVRTQASSENEGASFVPKYSADAEVTAQDKEYLSLVDEYQNGTERQKKSAWDKLTAMVQKAAEMAGFKDAIPEQMATCRLHVGPTPKKTRKVYKTFYVDKNGRPSALFVESGKALPEGVWLDAIDGWHFTAANGKKYVPTKVNENRSHMDGRKNNTKTGGSVEIPNDEVRQQLIERGFLPPGSKAKTITCVAYRPGWHAGDLPFFPQGGTHRNAHNYNNAHEWNQVVFECEMSFDIDYTNTKRTKEGKERHLDMQRMPVNGGYVFGTNPILQDGGLGNWYISHSLKIGRALTQEECDSILEKNGMLPQEWEQGKMNLEDLGYTGEEKSAARKTLAPITYDDNGNVIPLSERFNPKNDDVRYSADTNSGDLTQYDFVRRDKLNVTEKLISDAARQMGIMVRFVDAPMVKGSRGVMFAENGIIINRKGNVEPRIILFHELTHWLKMNNPDVYAKLREQVNPTAKQIADYAKTIANGRNMEDELIIDEMIADAVAMSDARHDLLQQMINSNKSLGMKIVGTILNAWHRIKDAILTALGNSPTSVLSTDKNGNAKGLTKHEIDRITAELNKAICSLKSQGKTIFSMKSGQVFNTETGTFASLYSFAGEKSQTAALDQLDLARRMKNRGESDQAIWAQTGWKYSDKDKKWRYEIPDNLDAIKFDTLFNRTMYRAPLKAVYDNPALYAAYPWLAKVPVKLADIDEYGHTIKGKAKEGSAEGTIIRLKYDAVKNDVLEQKLTLIHEIQHLIQYREGFAEGGNGEEEAQKHGITESEAYNRMGGEQESFEVERRAREGITDMPTIHTEDAIVVFDGVETPAKLPGGTVFSGGGLVEVGLKGLIKKMFAVEYNPSIAAVYKDNHGEKHVMKDDLSDVRNFAKIAENYKGKLEYFHASPVCCNYSNAKADAKEDGIDIETARAVAEILEKTTPSCFTLENVAKYRNSKAIGIIMSKLDELGYTHDDPMDKASVYNAADYGAGTSRERLLIRATRLGELPERPKKVKKHKGWKEVAEKAGINLDSLPERPYQEGTLVAQEVEKEFPRNDDGTYKNDTGKFVLIQGRRYGRLAYREEDVPFYTITACDGEYRVLTPKGRMLDGSPQLMAAIQGLPASYKLPKKKDGTINRTLSYRIIGNGVPPALARAVYGPLLKQTEAKLKMVAKYSADADPQGNPRSSLLSNIKNWAGIRMAKWIYKALTVKADKNVKVDLGEPKNSPNRLEVLFRSPTRLAEKYPQLKYFVDLAEKASVAQEKLRAYFVEAQNEMNEYLANGDFEFNRKQLQNILLMGDSERKSYTDAELRDMGATEGVIKGYRKLRETLEEAWERVNDVYQKAITETKTISGAEYREMVDGKVPFVKIVKAAKLPGQDRYQVTTRRPKTVVRTEIMNEQELNRLLADPNVYIADRDKDIKPYQPSSYVMPGEVGLVYGDRFYEVTYETANPSIGHIQGYVPHIFHDFFVVQRFLDEKGNEIGTQILKSYDNLADATDMANKYAAEHPDKQFGIVPKRFSFPGEAQQAAVMGDMDYFNVMNRTAETLSITPQEAQRLMNDSLRMKNRGRFLDALMSRDNAQGYEKDDVYRALQMYFNQVGRYVALDDFKRKSINQYEQAYGDFNSAKATVEAQAVRNYINDVNGVPTGTEVWLNDAIKSVPVLSKLTKSKAGGRPSVWLAHTITYPMSVAKLGLLNVSSALVNMTQLLNLAGALDAGAKGGFHYLKVGMGEYWKSKSDAHLNRLLMEELGLRYTMNLADYNSYSKGDVVSKLLNGSTMHNLADKSFWAFRKVDEIARGATLLGAYRKAMDEGMSHDDAIKYARDIDHQVNFEYNVFDAPDMFRRFGPIGTVAFQFQKYPVKEIELLWKIASRGYERGGWKGLGKDMVRYTGPYFLCAGMYGLPFVGILAGLVNGIVGAAGGDDDWDLETELKKWAKDNLPGGLDNPLAKTFFYGVSSNFGLNIGQRVGIGDFGSSLLSNGYQESNAGWFGKLLGATTIGNTFMQAYTNFMNNGMSAETIKAITPYWGGVLQAANGQAKTSLGRLKYRYDPYDRLLRAAGFSPMNEKLTSDIAQIEYSEKRKERNVKQDVIDDFLDAEASKDTKKRNDAYKKFDALGIKPADVKAERDKRNKTKAEREAERQAKLAQKKPAKHTSYAIKDYQ